MKGLISAPLVCAGLLLSAPVAARDIHVEITNLTNGLYFTPLLVAAHPADARLFELATPASANLQAMAEGGDISGLAADVEAAGGIQVSNPAGDVLAPGASTSATLDVHGRDQRRLSVVAMLLPSNDGFMGLNAVRIPRSRGRHVFYVRGYDAGTEANDEIINGGGAPGVPGIPADPGANNGVNATGAAGFDHNPTVHVHRGVLGDADPLAGPSDLDSAVHRFNNPVARVVITIGHHHD